MPMFVIVQPTSGDGAEVMEPAPGSRQLLFAAGDAAVSVQVPSTVGGLVNTSRFARSLSSAAQDFAEWCERQAVTQQYFPGFSEHASELLRADGDQR